MSPSAAPFAAAEAPALAASEACHKLEAQARRLLGEDLRCEDGPSGLILRNVSSSGRQALQISLFPDLRYLGHAVVPDLAQTSRTAPRLQALQARMQDSPAMTQAVSTNFDNSASRPGLALGAYVNAAERARPASAREAGDALGGTGNDDDAAPPLDVSLRTELAELAPAGPPQMVALLRRNSREALEALYTSKEPGPIPEGVSDGRGTTSPGTWIGWIVEQLAALIWKGKIFDRETGTLINRFPFGIKALMAKVYYGTSWLDGKTSIIIDYKDTAWLVGWIRDEIRMIAPGLYLGLAYARAQDGPWKAIAVFTLDFNTPKASLPEPPTAAQKTTDLQTP